jgi:hypothetical protein
MGHVGWGGSAGPAGAEAVDDGDGISERRQAASPLRTWVAEEPCRAVPDLDFGTRWTDPATPDRYHRLAWIPTTGELYLTDSAESYVRVLARIPTAEQVAKVLDGWTTVSSRPEAPLRWVEDCLAQWQRGADD